MERNKLYYLLKNQKQTLISCDLKDKKIEKVLKFNGKDWVEDSEVEEIVIKLYDLYLMSALGKRLHTDYEVKKYMDIKKANYVDPNDIPPNA